MSRRVAYSPRARDQLTELYDYIAGAGAGTPAAAERFVGSVVDYCDDLADFPLRGRARDDLHPALRLLGFRRRVMVAFLVLDDEVRVVGVFYGGRDAEAILTHEDYDRDE